MSSRLPHSGHLDAVPAGGQRFPRCVQCQTDNGRFASACRTCGADLQAPKQLAYNEELWREREQAEAQAREQQAVLQKAHQRAEAEQRAEQQRYAERLSQAYEEERSDWGELGPLPEPSLGVALLRGISSPLARGMALACAIGLPILLVRYGDGPLYILGLLLGLFVALSFIPSSFWNVKREDDKEW